MHRMEKASQAMTSSRAQTYIPGTEPPEEIEVPEITEALDAWLEAKQQQRAASFTTRVKHQTLMMRMADHKLERYPFVDPSNGRKKCVLADSTPKAKITPAPKRPKSSKQARGSKDDSKDDELGDVGEEVTAESLADDKVEHRKVKRSTVESEIDPFGATRNSMGPEQ